MYRFNHLYSALLGVRDGYHMFGLFPALLRLVMIPVLWSVYFLLSEQQKVDIKTSMTSTVNGMGHAFEYREQEIVFAARVVCMGLPPHAADEIWERVLRNIDNRWKWKDAGLLS